jgi:hypothetical protein
MERWKRATDKEGSRVWVKDHQSTWVAQEEDIFLPGAWLCSDERKLGHCIILAHQTWYVIEELWAR